MSTNVLHIAIFLSILISTEVVQSGLLVTETVLCRSCGSEISSSRDIFSKPSSKSYYNFIDSLFGNDEVLVEVFLTSFLIHYPVITFYHSSCTPVGEWESETSWYPGYRWKLCACPECGEYIGWVFEPIQLVFAEPSDTFYGLLLNSLISETMVNSLIAVPQINNGN